MLGSWYWKEMARNSFGPGHNSIIVQDDAGTDWMIYHSYVKENGEVGGRLGMLDRVLWTEDGWPYIKKLCAFNFRFSSRI